VSNHVDHYVGVDINKLQPQKNQRLEFHSEFNFVTEHKKLIKDRLFDVVVHLEVIEHMKIEHGRKMLRNCHECLKPGGLMIMSTPCYDGKRHAANHIHEYTVEELQKETEKAGFEIVGRFGCFMDIKHIGKPKKTGDKDLDDAVSLVYDRLNKYYDNDALSCIFAPLYPDNARNNLWVCKKIDKKGKK
jgi:SAM-dependent methyltransferase